MENAAAAGDTAPAPPNASSPTFLTIPRELRDAIYGIMAEDEKRPFQVKATKHPFGGARIKPALPFSYVCRQIFEEYVEVLEKSALVWSPSNLDRSGRWFLIEIWDMKFDMAMEFLRRLGSDEINKCEDVEFYFSLRFSADSSATRNDVLRWLQFCEDENITAYYHAPHFDREGGRRYRNRLSYVHIYDLFEGKTDILQDPVSEEDKLVWTLQTWYALRGCSNGNLQHCDRRRQYVQESEKQNAEEQGWLKAKTAAERDMAVRAAFPPLASQCL